ncbi:ATP-dependent acyl-CoA ligase [Neobacillus sp. NPDC097160]|uniref:ATP-dependent acyl-CoA ligase n=1 Tax=Neobacillus sp. NPDC097160 TaxID=3364298 RepID=UPI0037FD0362
MQNIREVVERAATLFGEKTFLYFENEEISFSTLHEQSGKVANAFKKLGIKKGDKVALFLPNCKEFIYTWIGLNKLGAVMVPVNTFFKENETTFVINNSDSKIILTDSNSLEMIISIRGECEIVENVIVIDKGNTPEVLSFYELIKNELPQISPVEISLDDDAAILYTSGTTGNPKGCVVSQSYYLVNAKLWLKHQELTSEDRFLTPLPFFHMNPQILTTMGALTIGASVILLDRFHPKTWWEDVARYGATQFHYLGVMPAILNALPPSQLDTAHKVNLCLGAGISYKFHESFEKRFNLKTLEVFGMTETGLNMITPIKGDRKLGTGSMGKVLPGIKAKVVDGDDKEVPIGTPGELVLKEEVRAEGSSMMKYYYKNEKATKEAWRNGWFHTGDIVRQDEEGFFYFVDRKKDIIRRSGENISSMEIEDCIRNHPKVVDAAAVPFPDPIREQEVRVCIILKPGESSATIHEGEIIKWCTERLAYFKVPRFIEFVSEFPKTASQKVQKSVLKNLFSAKTFDKSKKEYVSLKSILEEVEANVQ